MDCWDAARGWNSSDGIMVSFGQGSGVRWLTIVYFGIIGVIFGCALSVHIWRGKCVLGFHVRKVQKFHGK